MMEATTIRIHGNTLTAEDYQRVCSAWQQARQPITVCFELQSEVLFEQDEHIVEGTVTVLPLPGEESAVLHPERQS
jgi:hypothetical protein